MAELVDDLAQLSSIDDSVVMATLKTRHEKDEIYTKNGAVLIAINPYKTIHLYDDGKLAQYKGSMSLESEPPHIFAVSATAHRAMISNGVNQALVISGESGAGKTESARFILQYLRYVSNASHGLEEKVYKSQPITEAFGCAKTVRNDNSSRFGKFLKLYFDKSARIKARLPPSAPPRPRASPPAHRPPSEPGGALGRRARARWNPCTPRLLTARWLVLRRAPPSRLTCSKSRASRTSATASARTTSSTSCCAA